MYVPGWFILLLAVLALYLYFHYAKRNMDVSNMDGMWKQAEQNVARVMEKSVLIEDFLEMERGLIMAMEHDMLRLRERYKHNQERQKEIAKDWMDYSEALAAIRLRRELLDADWESGAMERFEKETTAAYITAQEITKRVEKELGEDCDTQKFLKSKDEKTTKSLDQKLEAIKKL